MQFLEVGPGLVPALYRITRISVAKEVGQAHQERTPRAGICRTRVEELVRIFLGPSQKLLRRGRDLLDAIRHIFEQRAGWVIGDDHAEILAQRQHAMGRFKIDCREIRQGGGVIRQKLDPQVLGNTCGKCIGACQNEIDVEPVRSLLRFDFAWKFRGWCLGERDLRHKFRLGLGVIFDSAVCVSARLPATSATFSATGDVGSASLD